MPSSDGNTGELARSFQVETWMHHLSGFVHRNTGFWKWLGNLETGILSDELARIPIQQPIYVTGLARSGSTLLLEMLNRHPDVVAHRYCDYPLLFTPFLWNRYLARTPQGHGRSFERAHGDGIFITPESPEAFEEMLWMAFFPDLHDPQIPAVLDQGTRNPPFERFYRDHIRKLLLIRGGRRYLAKGNYNVTRLAYLLTMFPDARIVIPLREPLWHIASSMRQHRRFCQGQQIHPRALTHVQRVGHFEFGLDRRPINAGDTARVASIIDMWRNGAEVEGWALYWAHIHDHLADRLGADPLLQSAVMIVNYEKLCRSPMENVKALFEHCRLPLDLAQLEEAAAMIRPPRGAPPSDFSDEDRMTIERCTAASARRLGLQQFWMNAIHRDD